MKAIMRTFGLAMIFLLCGAPSLHFNILLPAIVDLPSEIGSIAIIDRSQSENEVVNVLEKGLVSTIAGKANRMSDICLKGFSDHMQANDNIRIVNTEIIEKRPGTALDFPRPMDWFEVESLCKKYEVDALLSLEIFSKRSMEAAVEIKSGFRIYYPASKTIIDEFSFFHSVKKGVSSNDGELGSNLVRMIHSDDVVKDASYASGRIYGDRITPSWISVTRKYYKRSKGDQKLAEGARMMEANNWEGAIAAFELAIERGHPKTKGKATHNLAVVLEITGNLEQAYQTAQAAWGSYGNRASRAYISILQGRIEEMEILKRQEEN